MTTTTGNDDKYIVNDTSEEMMKKFIIYQVDAFTKEKFTGNPAGVVLNADGLRDEQMQRLARELNNSETAFLLSSDSKECDGAIRYFTPVTEVPTCGHATIAAMYANAVENQLDSCILRMRTRIGILPFEIIKSANDYQIVMTQGQFEISPTLDHNTIARIIAALGLERGDVDERCPIQIASTGHSKVLIGIKRRDTLHNLSPNYHDLADLSRQIRSNGYFVFTFDSDEKDILTCGRMFAPAIGINEDPVTGNAYGPLGGYLVHNKIVKTPESSFEFYGKQGESIKRSGVVHVRVAIEHDQPAVIQIKGEAVVVFRTEIVV